MNTDRNDTSFDGAVEIERLRATIDRVRALLDLDMWEDYSYPQRTGIKAVLEELESALKEDAADDDQPKIVR